MNILVGPYNWTAYIDTIPILITFLVFAGFIFVFCIKTWKNEKPPERRITEVTLGILFLVSAILFPPIIPSSMILLLNIVVIAVDVFLVILLISQILIVRKLHKTGDSEGLKQRDEIFFKEQFAAKFDDLKHDTARKSLHLISPSVITVCVLLGKIINNEIFSLTLILALGSAFMLLFAFSDLVRLLKFEYMPPKITSTFQKAMKKHEIGSFTATFDMILGAIPAVFFLPLSLVAAIVMISALADAAASIVGKRWGRHKFPKTGKKSVEGYVAGSIVAFLVGYIVILIFGFLLTPPITIASFLIPIAYASIAALVFLVLDILSLPMDDNILNPLCITFGFLPIWLIIGIPL